MSFTGPLKAHEQRLVIKTMIDYISVTGGQDPRSCLKLLQVVVDNDFTISRVFLKNFKQVACINSWSDRKGTRSTFMFENLQIINVDATCSWALKILKFSPDVLFMGSSHKYKNLIRELEIYGNLEGLKFIAGLYYRADYPGVVKAIDEMFGAPDMVFSDGTWIVKL